MVWAERTSSIRLVTSPNVEQSWLRALQGCWMIFRKFVVEIPGAKRNSFLYGRRGLGYQTPTKPQRPGTSERVPTVVFYALP
jgi:hypothetical protein